MVWQPPASKHCDRCDKTIKGTSSLRKHQTSKECLSVYNRRRVDVAGSGLVLVETFAEGSWAADVCRIAGVPTERDVLTFYKKGAYGRKPRTERRHVLPAWAWFLLKEGAGAFDAERGQMRHESLKTLIAEVIRRATTDLEYRKVVDAAVCLNGSRALWAFGVEAYAGALARGWKSA